MATRLSGGAADPIRKFRFEVVGAPHLPKGTVAFTEVEGLNLGEIDVIDYADGNDLYIRKLPGRTKYGNVTLRKGVDFGRHLASWMDLVNETLSEDADNPRPPRPDIDPRTIRITGAQSFRTDVIITVHDRTAANSNLVPAKGYQQWKLKNAFPCAYTLDNLSGSESAVLVETCVLCVEKIQLIYPR